MHVFPNPVTYNEITLNFSDLKNQQHFNIISDIGQAPVLLLGIRAT